MDTSLLDHWPVGVIGHPLDRYASSLAHCIRGHAIAQARRLDAGECGDPFENPVECLPLPLRLRVFRGADDDERREHTRRFYPRIHGAEAVVAAHEQTGTDEKKQCGRDLDGYENPLGRMTTRSASGGAAPSLHHR